MSVDPWVMHSAELGSEHNAQPPVMQVAYARTMAISSLRHLRRKANLDRLVTEAGGATALALLIDTPKSHISALQKGARGIGDRLAAKLERKFDKPEGWMDQQHEGEVLRNDGLSVIVDDASDSAFGVGHLQRMDLEILRDLNLMHSKERDSLLALMRVRSAAFSRGAPPSESGVTLGVTALMLAQASMDLPSRTRGHIAHLAGEMIENGPDESQASAIDALATVDVSLPLGSSSTGQSDSPFGVEIAGLDQELAATLQDLAVLSQTMTPPQRRAMVAALQGIKDQSWDLTQETSNRYQDRATELSFERRPAKQKVRGGHQ